MCILQLKKIVTEIKTVVNDRIAQLINRLLPCLEKKINVISQLTITIISKTDVLRFIVINTGKISHP